MRSRSFCIQDGVWFLQLEKKKNNERMIKMITSLFLSFSLVLGLAWGKGRVNEPDTSSKNGSVKVDINNAPILRIVLVLG